MALFHPGTGYRSFCLRSFHLLAASVSLLPLGVGGGCETYHPMPLDQAAVDKALRVPPPEVLRVKAASVRHPLLAPVELNSEAGLSPDGAAVIAVILSPTLRADRNRRGIGDAQVLQAGILPNPQLTYTMEIVTGGNTQGTVNPWGLGIGYDFVSLITHSAKVNAAKAARSSVYLDVAWVEWQTAEAAKTAVYDLASLQAQLAAAEEVDRQLAENSRLVRAAVARHEKVLIDLSAAESASQDAHSVALALKQQIGHQRLALLRSMGLPPDTPIALNPSIVLPSRIETPSQEELVADMELRRLDLVALRLGYQSQEQALRAAVLGQFPKINIGFTHARDNTNVISDGLGVTVDLPIFDRNQGGIATERATRQKLFDEYVSRVFQARSDIAMVLDDIAALTEQIDAAEQAVPGLRRLVETYGQAVNRGHADVLSYYTAQGNLAQKRLTVLKLKQQLIDDKIALELASGRYLPAPVPGAAATQPATAPTTGRSSDDLRGGFDFPAPGAAGEDRDEGLSRRFPSTEATQP